MQQLDGAGWVFYTALPEDETTIFGASGDSKLNAFLNRFISLFQKDISKVRPIAYLAEFVAFVQIDGAL